LRSALAAVEIVPKLNNPPFPFAGIICLLMGGLLLLSGGFRLGGILVGFAILWAAIAMVLKINRR
jgi:hypothetical protein